MGDTLIEKEQMMQTTSTSQNMQPLMQPQPSGDSRYSAAAIAAAPGLTAWPVAVWIHAARMLRRWSRSTTILISSVAMPAMMMAVVVIMFRGMIEQFSGKPMDLPGMSVMIAVTAMLSGALTNAGSTVRERHEGLTDRVQTFPGRPSASYIGRILAESIRSFIAAPIAMIVALMFGADFGSPIAALRVLLVMLLTAIASGAFGVMMGYLAETPQGAVSAAPLIMAAMFFNTAMMPRDLYAPALRPIVDASPMTALAELTQEAIAGRINAGHIGMFALWFGGLGVISIVVVTLKARRRS
jgi:ABC-2 type transport system permease protein